MWHSEEFYINVFFTIIKIPLVFKINPTTLITCFLYTQNICVFNPLFGEQGHYEKTSNKKGRKNNCSVFTPSSTHTSTIKATPISCISWSYFFLLTFNSILIVFLSFEALSFFNDDTTLFCKSFHSWNHK